MSTENLGTPNKILGTLAVRHSKQCVVNAERESLPDYVRRVAKEKGLSYRQVARRGGISAPSISDILSGKTKKVKLETLKALAKGLEVPEDEIFAIARGKTLESMSPHDFTSALEALGVEQFHVDGGLPSLTLEDQQEIIAMIKAMVEQKLKRKRSQR